jgi:hypothetical protein
MLNFFLLDHFESAYTNYFYFFVNDFIVIFISSSLIYMSQTFFVLFFLRTHYIHVNFFSNVILVIVSSFYSFISEIVSNYIVYMYNIFSIFISFIFI